MKIMLRILGVAVVVASPYYVTRTHNEKQLAEIAVILGLLLLSFVFLVLLDIKSALGEIRDLLEETNDADPHVAHDSRHAPECWIVVRVVSFAMRQRS